MIYILFFGFLFHIILAKDNLKVVSFLHTDFLQKYIGYSSVVIMHFQVPEDAEFVSFRFKADQTAQSIFSCTHDKIILYLNHGSIPLVNPDNSKLPKNFLNMSSPLPYMQLESDMAPHYVNLTNPRSGFYYAAAFLPYSNPQSEGITQAGLSPQCLTFIEATVYTKKYALYDFEGDSAVTITVPLYQEEKQTYKFFVPEEHDRFILTITNVYFCETCTDLSGLLFDNSGIPRDFSTVFIDKATYNNETIYYRTSVREASWYYMQFYFTGYNVSVNDYGQLMFDIKTFSSASKLFLLNRYTHETRSRRVNISDVYKTVAFKSIRNQEITAFESYKEYGLVKTEKSDSFYFSFDLPPSRDGSVPLSINLTERDFTSLKFFINEAIDTGGALDYIFGFQPRIVKKGNRVIQGEEPENYTVIVCIRNNYMEIPTWPNNCVYGNKSHIAPLVLNKTVTNSTVTLPFPESGWWYVTLKLFCDVCVPCKCPDHCLEMYNQCVDNCENACDINTCSNCSIMCQVEITYVHECTAVCDCDGPCKRTYTNCQSSVVFDVSSFPCISAQCGKNGRCVFIISQGILYSTCLCTNNYRGLDCSDDTDATSYPMLVLEMCLLVLSNLIFILVTYFAYKRKYYVEIVVYASTFLSSSFYHMCDAGENVISFCIVRMEVLQFSDFFCGLLAIWVTLIAMAYLPQPWPSISHVSGCIVLAFCTTLAKQSLTVFVMPAAVGAVIVIGHWIYLTRKTGKLFPDKSYYKINLPIGLITTLTGAMVFALFQTQSNYKYLHSLWHLLMGIGVIIALPDLETFLPKQEARNNDELLEPVVDNGREPPRTQRDGRRCKIQ